MLLLLNKHTLWNLPLKSHRAILFALYFNVIHLLAFYFFLSSTTCPWHVGRKMAASDSLIISCSPAHYALDNPLYIHSLNE